jgi:hypothetical protein
MRITTAYLDRVMSAAETDLIVASRFMRVIGMIDAPARLLRPTMVLRILRANRARRAGPRPVDTSAVSELSSRLASVHRNGDGGMWRGIPESGTVAALPPHRDRHRRASR